MLDALGMMRLQRLGYVRVEVSGGRYVCMSKASRDRLEIDTRL